MYRRKEDDGVDIEFVDERLILESEVIFKFPLSGFIEILQKGKDELMALHLGG